MTQTVPVEGGCMCGAVRYELREPYLAAFVCHCRACQYVSGGGPAYILTSQKSKLTITKGHPRAFWSLSEDGTRVARHFCNECGNCGRFCPWDGRPYTDKPTVFSSPADFENSSNPGWLLDKGSLRVRFQGRVRTLDLGKAFKLSEGRGDGARFFRLFELLHLRRPHLFNRLSTGGAA